MKYELEPYNRGVSDEVLLDDLRKVALQLRKDFLTQKEYEDNGGRFSAGTIKKRIGWCKAHELAGLRRTKNFNTTPQDCIDNYWKVAERLGKRSFTKREYNKSGGLSDRLYLRHFGSWKAFVQRAGSDVTPGHRKYRKQATEEQLFENIECLWGLLGRQPKTSDFSEHFSRFSTNTYINRFGSLRKALEAFVASVNKPEEVDSESQPKPVATTTRPQPPVKTHKTSRSISWRMRFLVMRRDNFKCCTCGIAPAIKPGTVLVVDHIDAWDSGGETVMENLQTLCEPCNGGKSNLPMKEGN